MRISYCSSDVCASDLLLAQPPETAATAAIPFDRRAAQLVDVLTGKLAFAAYFAPSFQAAIPEAQFKAITAGLIAQYGQPLADEAATSTDGHAGTVRLRFERGVGPIAHATRPAPAARVVGRATPGLDAAAAPTA